MIFGYRQGDSVGAQEERGRRTTGGYVPYSCSTVCTFWTGH